MAVDMLQTGVLGLKAAQRQLITVGHNITNANTPGYSRQSNIQATTTEFFEGGNYFGTGTFTSEVRRAYLSFAYFDLIGAQTQTSYSDKLYTNLVRIDDTMSGIGRDSVLGGIEKLFEALNFVVDNPADLGLREVFIEKARSSVQAFNTLYSNISNNYSIVNDDIAELANKITSIGEQIAQLNVEIVKLSGPGKNNPNDLLDKRDLLLRDLSKLVNVDVVDDDLGSITVLIGGKAPLVSRDQFFRVGVQAGQLDPAQKELYLLNPTSTTQQRIRLSGATLGGEIAALFDYRDNVLGVALDRIGLSALALADAFNEQQSFGADLNGNLGVDLFDSINQIDVREQRVFTDTSNTGTLNLNVEITDVNLLDATQFKLEYLGTSQYTITDLTTGSSSTVGTTTSGTIALSGTTFDGFTININAGTAIAGDTFLIQPSRYASSEIGLFFEQPELLATSSLVDVVADDDNVSPASVSIVGITDFTDANFPSATTSLLVTALQTTAGTYEYNVYAGSTQGTVLASNVAYTPPQQDVTIGGLTFRIEGNPAGEAPNAPERYEIVYAYGPGNNLNALDMSDIQNRVLLNDGENTISDNFEQVITNVGSQTSNAEILAVSNEASFNQTFERYTQASGVNLDEEGAFLLQYQQAYIASTRVITTARTIIDTLLEAAR